MNPQLKTKEAEHSVRVILDAMCCALSKGGRIEIRGFGSFSLNRLSPKQQRKPDTGGKTLKSPAKYIPHFKPAKELRARASKGIETGAAEIYRPILMPPELLNHDEANDTGQTAIYA